MREFSFRDMTEKTIPRCSEACERRTAMRTSAWVWMRRIAHAIPQQIACGVLRVSPLRCILKSPVEMPGLDNSRLGLIGFDGDLFVAGKRAENAGSARRCPLQKNKC